MALSLSLISPAFAEYGDNNPVFCAYALQNLHAAQSAYHAAVASREGGAEIIDADPWGETPYVATRYVPGLSLHQHVREHGPVEGEDLRWFAACLAEAMAAVHTVGVLHRDIKPSNVIMEGRTPILIDFGLARVADALGEAGIASIRFDFAGAGDSTEPFTKLSYTTMLADSNAALVWAVRNMPVDKRRIGGFGYSEGSAVVAMQAVKHCRMHGTLGKPEMVPVAPEPLVLGT